uniref:Pro-corazonin n=1 Tax=Anopheles funestus TaxID=62324 RepID=A0A182RRS6_ANOFN
MLHIRTIAFLLVGLIVLVNAQTFQYSRGWTNGKRSSSVEPVASQGPVSAISSGTLGSLKPNEKTLLRRFLRNPCDLRVANLLAGHPSKDLYQLAGNSYDSSESAGSAFILPQFLMDPDEGNGNSNLPNGGRPMEDELRFKRGTSSGIGDPRQKIA